jgi:PPOX class probable F420-dependent enzyme
MSLTGRAREVLTQPNYGVVVTLGRDGAPQLSTVWLDVEGDAVVFVTYEPAAKTRNLRRDPRVAINVTDRDNPYEYVNVVGRVRALRTEGGAAMMDRLSRKYAGDDYRGHDLRRDWVVVEVEPERVTHYASDLYP